MRTIDLNAFINILYIIIMSVFWAHTKCQTRNPKNKSPCLFFSQKNSFFLKLKMKHAAQKIRRNIIAAWSHGGREFFSQKSTDLAHARFNILRAFRIRVSARRCHPVDSNEMRRLPRNRRIIFVRPVRWALINVQPTWGRRRIKRRKSRADPFLYIHIIIRATRGGGRFDLIRVFTTAAADTSTTPPEGHAPPWSLAHASTAAGYDKTTTERDTR